MKAFSDGLEIAVTALEESGDYRILRRFHRPAHWQLPVPTTVETRVGAFVDFETTSLDTQAAEILECSILPFLYGTDDRLLWVAPDGPYTFLNEPRNGIPDEIVKLTGITMDKVAGHVLDVEAIENELAAAAFLCSHHAGFDRRIAERFSAVARKKPWACSWADVPWRDSGFRCAKLEHLLLDVCRMFNPETHRAGADVVSGLAVLDTARIGELSAFQAMLKRARIATNRIWSIRPPYGNNEAFKREHWQWKPEDKAWTFDARDQEEFNKACAFARSIGAPLSKVTKITAMDRYSTREDTL